MRVMKVLLTVRDGPAAIQLDANPHAIEIKAGECRVVVPMFDDWGATERYTFRSIDVRSAIKGANLEIEFPDECSRENFHVWLKAAFAHAEHGYKTMYP